MLIHLIQGHLHRPGIAFVVFESGVEMMMHIDRHRRPAGATQEIGTDFNRSHGFSVHRARSCALGSRISQASLFLFASWAIFSAIMARIFALSAFPTLVRGNASMGSIRSGSLFLAIPIRSRNSPNSATVGARRPACMIK